MLCLLAAFPFLQAEAYLISQSKVGYDSDIVVPDDFASIQQAVDAAYEGSTIFVKAGVYREHVRINKTISLIGEEGAMIQEDKGGYPVVYILRGNFAEVKGFKLVGLNMSSYAGILVKFSSNVILIDNFISNCHYGIQIYDSIGVTLSNNTLAGNHFNLKIWGLYLPHFEHYIDVSNTVDSKPVYYWVDQHDRVVPTGAGYVALIASSNIVVHGLTLSDNCQGVLMAYTNNSVVFNCSIKSSQYGLHVLNSHGNFIFRNVVEGDDFDGIFLDSSRNNSIVGNEVFSNGGSGILVSWSPLLNFPPEGNFIAGNVVHDCFYGVKIEYSGRNNISCNILRKNKYGIGLDMSQNVVLSRNTIQDNDYGLILSNSISNVVYDNNFLNNGFQAQIPENNPSMFNWWNASLSQGGNYWSDYNGSDKMRGVDQNLPGADGIGDSPYPIGVDNVDYYPHMRPRSSDASPLARFSYEPLTPVVRHSLVDFRDESFDQDGSIIFRVWSFGDEDFSFDANASKTYMSPGVFKVAVFVVDDCGNLASAEADVSVRKVESIVDFSVPTRVLVGSQANASIILRDEFGDSLRSMPVQVFVNESGVEEFLGYFATNESGVATVACAFHKTGVFLLRIVFNGDEVTGGSTGSCIIIVESPDQYCLVLTLALLCFLAVTCMVLLLRRRKVLRLRRAVNGFTKA
jgi:parallel beta-helix repeat protein